MLKINHDCINSLISLIKDQDEFSKRAEELKTENQSVHLAILTIANAIEEISILKPNITLADVSIYSSFLMYNLIRIQIESNEI